MWLIINLHSHNFVHCVQIYHPILFNTTIPCLRQILPLSNSRRIRDRPSLPLAMKSWLRPPKHECIMYVPCVMPWNLRTRQRCWRSHMCIPWHTHACTHSSAAPQLADCPLILITDWCKWLPTALVGKIVWLVMTIRPFPQQLQNRLTLNLIFCICVGHYHGSLGIESQGYRLRVKVSKAGNVVSLTSDHWSQGS